MQARFGFDVRIETRQDEEGWWGLIHLFQYATSEPPLLVGPCDDEASALERAKRLAKDIAG